MEEKRFLVYGHYTKNTNEFFYIGEGTKRRPNSTSGRNIYWRRKYEKYGGFYSKIFIQNLTKKEATRLESKIIINLKKRGYKLTNLLNSTISDYVRKNGNKQLSERNKKNIGELSPVFGLKRPDLSLRNKAGNFNRYVRKVRCIETGEIFDSIKLANQKYNKTKSSHINQQIKGKRKTAFGHKWEYC